MYTYKLDDIVSKYNNKYHSTIKIKPVDIKSNTYIDFGIENNGKDPQLVIVQEHQSIKTFLQNFTIQIVLNKVF